MTLMLQYAGALAGAALATGIALFVVRNDFFLPLFARLFPPKFAPQIWLVVTSAVIGTLFVAAWPPLPSAAIQFLPRRISPLAAFIGLVMAIMLAVVLSIGIGAFWRFHRAKRDTLAFLGLIESRLTRGQYDEVIELTKQYRSSHLARVIAAGLLEYDAAKRDKRASTATVRDEMGRATIETVTEMKSGLQTLATIGATAPLIGLFGTVIGIINAFRGMASQGSGGLDAVSTGIAEASLATALGLVIAIPAVWAANYLQNRLDRFTAEMMNASSRLQEHLEERRDTARART